MTAPHILVVDDEPDIRELVKEILEDEGYRVCVAEDGESARKARRERRPDLILLDIWMPDIDGLSLFKEWQTDQDDMPPVVIMSGHGTVETAVEATRLGAYDFLEKPLSMSKLLLTIRHALDDFHLRRENAGLKRHVQPLTHPLGKSDVMSELRSQADQVAESEAAVLLQGEAGVGKRLLARYIHDHSGHHSGPFIELGVKSNNPQELANKLFGKESADGNVRYGLLEQANGGTLFFNEVSDLDIGLQGELATVLQSGSLIRRGGTDSVKIDLRVISSTRRNILREIKVGNFREDLYYNLNVVPLALPPLRDHRDDISELLTYYVDYFVESEGLSYRAFSVAAQNKLRNHSWPGNVREFVNLIHRLLILGKGEIVESAEVEQALGNNQSTSVVEGDMGFDLPLRQARDQFEKSYFEYHLRLADGNVSQVAKKAGIERTHLYRKMKALDINPKDEVG